MPYQAPDCSVALYKRIWVRHSLPPGGAIELLYESAHQRVNLRSGIVSHSGNGAGDVFHWPCATPSTGLLCGALQTHVGEAEHAALFSQNSSEHKHCSREGETCCVEDLSGPNHAPVARPCTANPPRPIPRAKQAVWYAEVWCSWCYLGGEGPKLVDIPFVPYHTGKRARLR